MNTATTQIQMENIPLQGGAQTGNTAPQTNRPRQPILLLLSAFLAMGFCFPIEGSLKAQATSLRPAAEGAAAQGTDGELKTVNIGCVKGALNGYFRPENWTIQSSGTGNIPSWRISPSGEGRLDIQPGQSLQLAILIPAEGHLYIDWQLEGAASDCRLGTLLNQSFTAWPGSRGAYFSEPLSANRNFVLSLSNNGTQTASLTFSHFQLLTQARTVAVRYGDSGRPVQASVLSYAADFSRILFPANQEVYHADDLSPAVSGFPFLDGDGHPASKNDQQLIQNGAFGLEVGYEDRKVAAAHGWTIHRQWTIFDPCTGNQISHVQVIRLREAATSMTEVLGRSNP